MKTERTRRERSSRANHIDESIGRESVADGEEVKPLRSTSLAGPTLPTRILVTPWGRVESTSGSFVVDDESARLVGDAISEHGTDLPIDYEHQTLGGEFASPTGKAPAAGWIKRIVGEAGVGLLADIEWTQQASEMLQAREYRYLSPVALVRKGDRKLIAIHSAALTNKPAIVGMAPIVHCEESPNLLDKDNELAVLRAELSLPADADVEQILIKAGRRILELNEAARSRYVERRVREATEAGKLVEAQRAWAESLVAREEGLFDEWLNTAPVVVLPGRSAAPFASDSVPRRIGDTERRARHEFRGNAMLTQLTSEAAYVADAARQANRSYVQNPSMNHE